MDTATIVNIFLISLGLLLIFVEVLLGISSLFDLVLSGGSLVVGGAIGLIFGNGVAGLVASIVLLIGYWIVGRRIVRNRLEVRRHLTNSDKLIGVETTIIRVTPDGNKHTIRIEGEEWTAIATAPLAPGTVVRVVKVNGPLLDIEQI